jgi:mRNA interferase MazF
MNEEGVKKFIEWTKLKIRLHTSEREIYFREGEIWWASLGANIGHEQDGKNENFERPVLVLKKFNQFILWVVPLTSQIKEGNPYYVEYKLNGEVYATVISQLRLVSSKRLLRKVGIFLTEDFEKVREEIKKLI